MFATQVCRRRQRAGQLRWLWRPDQGPRKVHFTDGGVYSADIFSNEERNRLVFMLEAAPEEPEKLRPGQPVTVSHAAIKASIRSYSQAGVAVSGRNGMHWIFILDQDPHESHPERGETS
jgi:hypothetical protein